MTLCLSIGRVVPAVSAGACVKHIRLGKKQSSDKGCSSRLVRCCALKPGQPVPSLPQHMPDQPARSIPQRRLKLPGSAVSGDPNNRSTVTIQYKHDGSPLTREELDEKFKRIYPETPLFSDQEWDWMLEDVPPEKQAKARQAVEAMRKRRRTRTAGDIDDANGSASGFF